MKTSERAVGRSQDRSDEVGPDADAADLGEAERAVHAKLASPFLTSDATGSLLKEALIQYKKAASEGDRESVKFWGEECSRLASAKDCQMRDELTRAGIAADLGLATKRSEAALKQTREMHQQNFAQATEEVRTQRSNRWLKWAGFAAGLAIGGLLFMAGQYTFGVQVVVAAIVLAGGVKP